MPDAPGPADVLHVSEIGRVIDRVAADALAAAPARADDLRRWDRANGLEP